MILILVVILTLQLPASLTTLHLKPLWTSATPDGVDGMDGNAHEPYGNTKLQTIHWVTQPRKRVHLEANVDDDRL